MSFFAPPLEASDEIDLPVFLRKRFEPRCVIHRTEHKHTILSRERSTEKTVKISKILRGAFPLGLLLRLEHEALLLKGVQGTGFPELLECWRTDDHLTLITEFVEGKSAKSILEQRRRLEFEVSPPRLCR